MLNTNLTGTMSLILGTALWGWAVDRSMAFRLLDHFYELGGRIVDTATNYPINKCAADYGLALDWISQWVTLNSPKELSVLVKIGAVDNLGTDLSDLSPTNLRNSSAMLRDRLGRSLSAISVHWDNRDEDDYDGIVQTVEFFARIQDAGLSVGFSGVRRPDLYLAAAPELAASWWIQVKENVQTNLARTNYSKYFPQARYLAYGINLGGFKLETASDCSSLTLRGLSIPVELEIRMREMIATLHGLKPKPTTFNELALLAACLNKSLNGVIIGPRNIDQLEDAYAFRNKLLDEDSEKASKILINLGLIKN